MNPGTCNLCCTFLIPNLLKPTLPLPQVLLIPSCLFQNHRTLRLRSGPASVTRFVVGMRFTPRDQVQVHSQNWIHSLSSEASWHRPGSGLTIQNSRLGLDIVCREGFSKIGQCKLRLVCWIRFGTMDQVRLGLVSQIRLG